MVEYTSTLDSIFSSLADPTRRDILLRVSNAELTVSEIAQPYDMSLAAISKHLKTLEKAKLIIKRRRGKEQFVSMNAAGLTDAGNYLEQYRQLWEQRLETLDEYLRTSN